MAQGTGLRILPAPPTNNSTPTKRVHKPRAEKQASAQYLAELWEVSIPTINRWTLHPMTGERPIPSIKVNGSRRYPLSKAIRWWNEHNGWTTSKAKEG
ncbi:hypothetical protein [Lacticaseibacillus zhaodongensis]|uniref:hypothetical protein n=1 Tax=Lacticaseibacillus zhaodongensis TaxID=2668065 RepID=UPI0012D2FD6C|nr:hypothetical protein [Lacticaseibacillus zhaodongensis]